MFRNTDNDSWFKVFKVQANNYTTRTALLGQNTNKGDYCASPWSINRDNKNNSLKDILILLYIFNVYCGTIEGRIVKNFKVSFENTQSNHCDQNSELNILKIKSLIWDIFVLSNRMAKNQSKSCNFLYILQGIYKKCF